MTASFLSFRPFRHVAALLGAAVLAVAFVAPAQGDRAKTPVFGPAIDWSVLARLTETFEVDSNRQLDGVNDGIEARGIIGLGVTVSGRGKRSRFSVATGFNAGRSTDNDVSNLNRLDPNIDATAAFLGKGFTINASLAAQTRATSVSEQEDTGITDQNATRFDASASIGVSWQATKRDNITITASTQIVDFSRSIDTLTPSQTFGLSGGWSRRVTETTSYSFSTSFRHFEADGDDGLISRTASAQFGVQHQRTSRHSLGATAGLSFVSTDLTNGSTLNRIGFVGGGTFGYTIDEFNASLNLNQSIQPSSEGELRAFTSLGGSLGYRINQLERLSFGVRYTRRSDVSGGGDVLQFLSLGPTYSYSLSERTALSLSYQFRIRDDETTDFETGHQLLLSLSHSLTLLQ